MNYRWMWVAALAFCAHAQTPGTIAYTRAPDGGPPWPVQDVCTVRSDGSLPRALTADGHSHDPSWSPDGKRILFIHDAALSAKPGYRETAEDRSHHSIELSIMDADGRNRRMLRVIEPGIYSAAWSPDGARLAISAYPGEETRAAIFLLAADGTGELQMVVANGWTPAWSPDGTKLAFAVEMPRGRWTLHTANADGTNDVRLTDGTWNSGSPAWSPDGRRIAFNRYTDAEHQQVFVMNADGSKARQVTADTSWSCQHPSWSPDGSRIVVACRSAGSPCGRGFFSTGHAMPECTRRLFLVPIDSDSVGGTPTKVMERDGATPSFAPR